MLPYVRMAGAAARAAGPLRETAGRILRILRALFHEVVGFLFLAMAFWGSVWLVRAFRSFDGNGEALFKIVLVGAFVLMMGGFGVSSFWRARRISRGQ